MSHFKMTPFNKEREKERQEFDLLEADDYLRKIQLQTIQEQKDDIKVAISFNEKWEPRVKFKNFTPSDEVISVSDKVYSLLSNSNTPINVLYDELVKIYKKNIEDIILMLTK